MRFLGLITFLVLMVSCNNSDDTYNKLKQIDAMLYEESDIMADSLLNSIESENLDTPEKTMYFKLLKTGLLYRMGDHQQTDSTINQCVAFYEKTGDKEKLALSYFYRALVNWYTHNSSVLLDLKQAETYAENTSNYGLMAKIYSAITNFVGGSEEFQLALKYSKKGMAAAKKSGKEWLIVYANIDASITYKLLGYQDSALYYARQSEMYVWKLSQHYKTYVYNNIGTLLVGSNDSLAEAYLKKSLECEPLPQTYKSLAEIYNSRDDKQSTTNMWNKAINEAWPELKAEIFEAKAATEYKKGNFEECCNTLKEKEKSLKDYYESKLKNKVFELESKYNIDLLHHKIKTRMALGGITIFTIVAMLILFYRIRVRRIENKKMELELNYEKSKSALTLMEMRIADLETDKKSKTSELSKLKSKTEKLKVKIQNNIQHGHDLFDKMENGESTIGWSDNDLFCLFDYISTIYPDYIPSLETNYRGLNSQQKLFVIAMELFNKDIDTMCRMFALEKQSYYTKRYRIEKKRVNQQGE